MLVETRPWEDVASSTRWPLLAAKYVLDQPDVKHVAILDIDAHFGNGIALWIQDKP